MGLPFIALAKFKLLSSTRNNLSPLVATLLWLFILKLSFSYRLIRRGHADLIHSMRLFFFQIRQIVGSRWRRGLRQLHDRLISGVERQPPWQLADEESLHVLSMLAL